MRLILQNGYPFPYPTGLSEAESDKISDAAMGKTFEINGIHHFEMKHTLTVEFVDQESYEISQELTGWKRWCDHTLEATTSGPDGYGHPAIIVKDTAYCGFILKEE
jgi:hypothetical protein